VTEVVTSTNAAPFRPAERMRAGSKKKKKKKTTKTRSQVNTLRCRATRRWGGRWPPRRSRPAATPCPWISAASVQTGMSGQQPDPLNRQTRFESDQLPPDIGMPARNTTRQRRDRQQTEGWGPRPTTWIRRPSWIARPGQDREQHADRNRRRHQQSHRVDEDALRTLG